MNEPAQVSDAERVRVWLDGLNLSLEQFRQLPKQERARLLLWRAVLGRKWGKASGFADRLRLEHGWKHAWFVEEFGESWGEYADEMDEADSRGEA